MYLKNDQAPGAACKSSQRTPWSWKTWSIFFVCRFWPFFWARSGNQIRCPIDSDPLEFFLKYWCLFQRWQSDAMWKGKWRGASLWWWCEQATFRKSFVLLLCTFFLNYLHDLRSFLWGSGSSSMKKLKIRGSEYRLLICVIFCYFMTYENLSVLFMRRIPTSEFLKTRNSDLAPATGFFRIFFQFFRPRRI